MAPLAGFCIFMKKQLLLFFLALSYISLYCQKNDYVWIFGYEGGNQSNPNDEFGNAILDFSPANKPTLQVHQEYDMNFSTTCATICDQTGKLQFYTNGEKIYNYHHILMDNGEDINTNENGYGYQAPQGAIAIPLPDQEKKYALFHFTDKVFSDIGVAGIELYYNEIDMNMNNGLGKVTKKRILMLKDTLTWGKISAIKHANGRDWWVLMGTDHTNKIYEVLLTPDGAKTSDTLITDTICQDGLGQATFSPDGSKYIRANSVMLGEPFRVDVFDFDRCTGQLSNRRTKFLDYPGFGVGVAVSADSRYLYVMRTTKAFQYDLTADDIFATETLVAEWDGFISGAVYGSYFRFSQLGPDGRIYAASSPTFHLHQVNFPNRKGAACDFRQHSINLTVYNDYTIPNFPNYRLGPVDGSSCDTLGINNNPLANFRWEHEDSLDLLNVTFTDLSAYEPAQWHWDFGDGSTSQDTSPVHVFPAAGAYYVCLTVSNANSADTFCQQVTIGVSGAEEARTFPRAEVSPNPFRSSLHISLPASFYDVPQFVLFDLLGREVAAVRLQDSETKAYFPHLPPGVYLWELRIEGAVTQTGKIVHVE